MSRSRSPWRKAAAAPPPAAVGPALVSTSRRNCAGTATSAGIGGGDGLGQVRGCADRAVEHDAGQVDRVPCDGSFIAAATAGSRAQSAASLPARRATVASAVPQAPGADGTRARVIGFLLRDRAASADAPAASSRPSAKPKSQPVRGRPRRSSRRYPCTGAGRATRPSPVSAADAASRPRSRALVDAAGGHQAFPTRMVIAERAHGVRGAVEKAIADRQLDRGGETGNGLSISRSIARVADRGLEVGKGKSAARCTASAAAAKSGANRPCCAFAARAGPPGYSPRAALCHCPPAASSSVSPSWRYCSTRRRREAANGRPRPQQQIGEL